MAHYFGASDVQPMLDTFGVPVVVGAVTAKGIVNEEDQDEIRENFPAVAGKVRTVLVKTGTFTLTNGGDISVDGVAYKVHSFHQEGDGATTRVRVVVVK